MKNIKDFTDESEFIPEGYIKLARNIFHSKTFSNLNAIQKLIAIYLILMANHQDNEWWDNYQKKFITIEKGSFVTSVEQIRQKINDKLITTRKIRTTLKLLESMEFLTSKTTNIYTLITIHKYELYQNGDNYINNQNDKPLTTNNNDKDIKDIIYKIYNNDKVLKKPLPVPPFEDNKEEHLSNITPHDNITPYDNLSTYEKEEISPPCTSAAPPKVNYPHLLVAYFCELFAVPFKELSKGKEYGAANSILKKLTPDNLSEVPEIKKTVKFDLLYLESFNDNDLKEMNLNIALKEAKRRLNIAKNDSFWGDKLKSLKTFESHLLEFKELKKNYKNIDEMGIERIWM